jgi:hypothetical protein
MVEALEEAAMFHDARSRVIDTAARRTARRFPGRAVEPSATPETERRRAKEYAELAAKLRLGRSE